jgi:hypothetical protein
MLIDENDANIFSFLCKSVEGCLDGRCVGFAVYNKEVLLSIGASRDVLSRKVSLCIDEAQWFRDTHANTCKKQTCYRVLDQSYVSAKRQAKGLLIVTYFISDNGQKLAIFVVCLRSHTWWR